MHHLFGTNNFAAKGLTNTLVPRQMPKIGILPAKVLMHSTLTPA